MPDPLPLGTWLRRERERRGITLKQISDQTKVGVPYFEGLEAGDLSRWPGGIFRRGFVRAYATAVGLDADNVVRRFEEAYPAAEVAMPGTVVPAPEPPAAAAPALTIVPPPATAIARARDGEGRAPQAFTFRRTRVNPVLCDLLVAAAIGLGFAGAGSRLLWPVLVIAAYHALGALLTGTTPMIALLGEGAGPSAAGNVDPAALPRRNDQRQSRRLHRAGRAQRQARAGSRIQ